MKKKFLVTGAILLVALCALLYYFYSLPAPIRTDNPTDPGYISVSSIANGQTVGQKFTLTGQAYAAWFNESKVGVDVVAPDGSLVWTGHAFAQGDWTTDAVLPFSVDIDTGTYTGLAVVEIIRDNPSGDPAYDKQYSIPVTIQ